MRGIYSSHYNPTQLTPELSKKFTIVFRAAELSQKQEFGPMFSEKKKKKIQLIIKWAGSEYNFLNYKVWECLVSGKYIFVLGNCFCYLFI